MEEHANDASVAFFLATEVYKPKKNWREMNKMLELALSINPNQKLKGFSALKSKKKEIVKDAIAMYKEELWVKVFNNGFSLSSNSSKFDSFGSLEVDDVVVVVVPVVVFVVTLVIASVTTSVIIFS